MKMSPLTLGLIAVVVIDLLVSAAVVIWWIDKSADQEKGSPLSAIESAIIERAKEKFMESCRIGLMHVIKDATKSEPIQYTCYCAMERVVPEFSGKTAAQIERFLREFRTRADAILEQCAEQVGLVPVR